MKKINLNNLLGKPVLFFEKFHNKTKFKKIPDEILDPKYWPEEWKTINYKGYERLNEIILPEPNSLKSVYFKDALVKRKSAREFSEEPLDMEKISTLLHYGAGINRQHELKERRFFPSAGARYPLEVYMLSNNSAGIANGAYHYYVKEHSLEELILFKKKLDYGKVFNQNWIKKAAAIIVITAIFKRNTNKYGERGYRHVLIEAGHLAQNFYLVSSGLNISCCAIGGYVDDDINKLLDINSLEETVVYVLAIGEKKI